MGWFFKKRDIEWLKQEVEAAADQSLNPMANQTLSEGMADLMFPTVVFDMDTPRIERILIAGGDVSGFVVWETGARAPFVATVEGKEVLVAFGPWELVQVGRPYLS